jgi:acyl-CoA synthetase (NDP forming)
MALEAVYEAIVGVLCEDPNVDAVVVGVTPLAPLMRTLPAEMAAYTGETNRVITERLSGQAARYDKPLIAVVDSGSLYDSFALALEDGGLPVFRSGDQAMRTLGKYIKGRLHAKEIVLQFRNS